MNRRSFWLLPLCVVFALSTTNRVAAQSEIVLEVTSEEKGALSKVASYRLADLLQMPARTIKTKTVWTEGEQEFVGVSLDHLLRLFKIETGVLQAFALNDYMVVIPVEEVSEEGPIIAYERNGKVMSLREKGPLWIIYPYDDDPKFRREEIYARSIWQLNRIQLVP